MKNLKTYIFLGIAVALGLIVMGSYNGLVTANQDVLQGYGQVQNVMQRQADLIPNVVATVKGYATHEENTFKEVAEARAGLTAVAKMKPEDLAKNPALIDQMVKAQQAMNQSLIHINAVQERYPQLQANENFKHLIVLLEGSQNRISTERRKVQLLILAYNVKVQKFPGSIIASNFGFAPKPYFEADDAAKTVPVVKF